MKEETPAEAVLAELDERAQPAFLFDLDGTLIDSVYQHVIAWREALEHVGVSLSVWKLHRRIGMSGGLFVTALLRSIPRSTRQRSPDYPPSMRRHTRVTSPA